jgi:Uncharacterized protein conserved in bacteria
MTKALLFKILVCCFGVSVLAVLVLVGSGSLDHDTSPVALTRPSPSTPPTKAPQSHGEGRSGQVASQGPDGSAVPSQAISGPLSVPASQEAPDRAPGQPARQAPATSSPRTQGATHGPGPARTTQAPRPVPQATKAPEPQRTSPAPSAPAAPPTSSGSRYTGQTPICPANQSCPSRPETQDTRPQVSCHLGYLPDGVTEIWVCETHS